MTWYCCHFLWKTNPVVDIPYHPTPEAVPQIPDKSDDPMGPGPQHQQPNEWTTPIETPGTTPEEMEVDHADGLERMEILTYVMEIDEGQHQMNQPPPNRTHIAV